MTAEAPPSRAMPDALRERLSDLLAAAIGRDVRAQLAERDRLVSVSKDVAEAGR